MSQDNPESFCFPSCYYCCLCNQVRINGERGKKKGLPLVKWREDFWGSVGSMVSRSILPNSLISSGISSHVARPQMQNSCSWMVGVYTNQQEASLTRITFTNRYTSQGRGLQEDPEHRAQNPRGIGRYDPDFKDQVQTSWMGGK